MRHAISAVVLAVDVGHGAGSALLLWRRVGLLSRLGSAVVLGPDFKAQIAHGTDLLVECVPVVLRLRLVPAMVCGPGNGMAGHG
jgi:hypothetical protein